MSRRTIAEAALREIETGRKAARDRRDWREFNILSQMQGGATRDEAEAVERESHAQVAKMFEAREAVVTDAGGKRGVVGSVACPVCEGQLRYSIAASNGHIHATCATEGCVSWME